MAAATNSRGFSCRKLIKLKNTRINLLDIIVIFFLLGITGFILYKITVKLNYKWHWELIPQYLFRYDEKIGRFVPNYLIEGLLTTLKLSIWGGLLAGIFGLIMGIMRTSKSLFNRWVSGLYVELMRNLPPLVIIFIFYFFIGDQIMPVIGFDDYIRGTSFRTKEIFSFFFSPPRYASAFISALLTLAIFEGAYITEIVRAGIESIEKGQWEAARALGFSEIHIMIRIILPQALERLIPAFAGQFISLIKDSSIVSVISIQELSYQGTQLMASTYLTIETWITITVLYLVMTLTLSVAVGKLENHMAKKYTY